MLIIFTVLGMLAGMTLTVLALCFGGLDLLGYSIWGIIPVGAIIVGFLCGLGYFEGLDKYSKGIKGKHYLIGAVLAVLCFTGILYAEYRLAHVNAEGQLVYSLEGDHISNYYQEAYGQLNFVNYTQYSIETSTVAISSHGREMFSYSDKLMNTIFFLLNILGMIVGFFMPGSTKSK